MQVCSKPGRPQLPPERTVAAIGVFDGVHKGHQDVIRRAVRRARALKGRCVVVTFHPHPDEVLSTSRFPGYLSTIDERLAAFASLGADACLVLRFTPRFASLTAEDFIERYLVKGLGVRHVVIGHDFHFGSHRKGTGALLAGQGRVHGFSVEVAPLKKLKNKNIKSSYIKELVRKGEMLQARSLLGRPYVVRGRVVHGDARGRKLGFPTANLKPENVIIPPPGIYLAKVRLQQKVYSALLYIGYRPTFKTDKKLTLEAYLLNFKGRLYGQSLTVEVLKKVRDDMSFPDEKLLVSRIERDVAIAQTYFKRVR